MDDVVRKYLCKFLNKKFNFNFSEIRGQKYILLDEDFYIYLDKDTRNNYYADLISGCHSYTLYNVLFKMPIECIKLNPSYKKKYLPIFMYFSKSENISNIYNYIDENYKFLYLTTYIQKLPLAYTFILSNNKNKIFPREIAKLIVRKLLFFLPQKN